MSCISALWSFGIYTSPFILTSLYRRDMFTPNGAVTISKFLVGVCALHGVNEYKSTRKSNKPYI